MQGLHIIADLKEINFNNLKINKKNISEFISNSIKKVSLTELWSFYHTFSNENEITWVIALAESHISFHTWPEKDYISLDIFVCNLQNDNTKKAKELYLLLVDFFAPKKIEEKFLERNF